jgi:low temperature requirement protein LtrA
VETGFSRPRLLTVTEEGERRASWLELFFDLVFVVAITELSH